MDNYENIYKYICRICLSGSKSENMVCLLDDTSADGLSCYGKSVATFADISINYSDKLPKMMCKNCLSLLKQAIRFKLKCEASDKGLKKLIKCDSVSGVDYKQTICQYTIFKRYFPEVCTNEQSKSSITSNNNEEFNKSHIKAGVSTKNFDYAILSRSSVEEQETDCNSAIDVNSNSHKHKLKRKEYDIHKKNRQRIFDSDDLLDKLESIVNIDNNVRVLNKMKNKYTDSRKSKRKKIENTILTKQKLYKHVKTNAKRLKNKNRIQIFKHENDIKYSSNNQTHLEVNQQNTDANNKIKRIKQDLPQKNFNCEICNKVLANLQTYRNHMQRHNGYRFMCDSCGKGFPNNAELNLHRVALHGTGEYMECNYCSYKAPRRLTLIEHIRLHTGERPYTCDKCGMTFRRQAIWSKHVIRHTEKNVQCLKCPKKFFLQRDMLAHMNNIHERLYMFMCNKCGVTYAKTKTVRRHLSQKHGIPREMQGKIIRVKKGVDVQFPTK